MKKSTKRKVAVGVGAGLALAAAAAVGTYLFTGKRGAKNRKAVKAWTLTAKKDIVAGVQKLKSVNKVSYHKVVDEVMKRYKQLKHIDQKEIAKIVSEAKGHWAIIQKQLAKKTVTKRKATKKKRA